MIKQHIVIATRESPLALCQAESIKALLMSHHPTLSVELLGMTTTADKRLDVTLSDIGGKGLFVKELEEALLAGRADIAVHSMKDVPMWLPPGLCLPVIAKREEPRDVFVSNHYASLWELPDGASLGTSSLRRQTQVRALRPGIALRPLRGNIQTRLKRLDQGDFDGLILAAAGLMRLDLTARIASYLSTEESLPAAGQGALGIECREDDAATTALIAPLNEAASYACVSAERALCRRLGGGCQAPVAAFAELKLGVMTLRGLVANDDGTEILRAELKGDPSDAERLGTEAAEILLQAGANDLLKAFYAD